MRPGFLLALLLSISLHLALFAVPGWYVSSLLTETPEPEAIEARIVPAPQLTKAVTKVPPRIVTKPPPREMSPQSPETAGNIQPIATEQIAATETPPMVLEPEIATEPDQPGEVIPDAIPDVAPPLPRSGRIRYSVTRGIGGLTIGQAIHEWRHDGKRYSLNASMETTGIAAIFKSIKVTQSSEGGFLKGELKPENFRFDRGGNDVATAHFDWTTQQVTLGDGQVVSVSNGAEDFLSMFYQLMQAAQHGEGFVMAVANGRKVERYAFEWLGEEHISLRPGRFTAWRVRVCATSGCKDTTEVWLGKEVAGLPIKIRFTDRKGDVSEQVAEEIEYEGQ